MGRCRTKNDPPHGTHARNVRDCSSLGESGAFMLFQSVPVENRLLAHLPVDAFDMLRPHLRRVQLKRQDVLQEPHRPVSKVYFLERGMAIMFADSQRDGRVEVGMVGRFGLVGVPAVLGTRMSTHRCVVEIAGNALQVTSWNSGGRWTGIPFSANI